MHNRQSMVDLALHHAQRGGSGWGMDLLAIGLAGAVASLAYLIGYWRGGNYVLKGLRK